MAEISSRFRAFSNRRRTYQCNERAHSRTQMLYAGCGGCALPAGAPQLAHTAWTERKKHHCNCWQTPANEPGQTGHVASVGEQSAGRTQCSAAQRSAARAAQAAATRSQARREWFVGVGNGGSDDDDDGRRTPLPMIKVSCSCNWHRRYATQRRCDDVRSTHSKWLRNAMSECGVVWRWAMGAGVCEAAGASRPT